MTHPARFRESPYRMRLTRTLPKKGPDASQRVTDSPTPWGDRLLNVEEAAALLGLKPSTLYTWASERRISTVKVGRALRIRLSVVEQLIRDCERPALDALQIARRTTEG